MKNAHGRTCNKTKLSIYLSIYLCIYLSIWKPFWKRVYIYTRLQKGFHIERYIDKKTQTTCSFQIGTKNPTRKKFIVEPSFFTSWTIANEKCTRAHVQENKSIYLSIHLSIWKPFWKRIYIYRKPVWRFFCSKVLDTLKQSVIY